jgi:hypothetical protein
MCLAKSCVRNMRDWVRNRMAAIPSRHERTRCVRRGWIFERVGWVAMALLTAAGVAGLFGDGWLSRAEGRAGDELTVTYQRYARAHAPLELTLDWLVRRQDPTLWISRSYLDEFTVEDVTPSPLATTAGPDRIYYAFRTVEPEGRARVTFTLKPRNFGGARGRVGSDEVDVEVRQFVFP